MRGAAAIFYLSNPAWSPGDGGETGLYASLDMPVDRPEAAVPPVDNSLLVFECTPWSYHAFRSNRRRPRNSVIVWIHRTREDALRRFGAEAIVKWRPRARTGA